MIQVENVSRDFDETMCNGETCNYRLQTMWNSNLWNEFSLRIVAMWNEREELFNIWLIFLFKLILLLLYFDHNFYKNNKNQLISCY